MRVVLEVAACEDDIGAVPAIDQLPFGIGQSKRLVRAEANVDEPGWRYEHIVAPEMQSEHRLSACDRRPYPKRNFHAIRGHVIDVGLAYIAFGRPPRSASQLAVFKVPDLLHRGRVDSQHPHQSDMLRGTPSDIRRFNIDKSFSRVREGELRACDRLIAGSIQHPEFFLDRTLPRDVAHQRQWRERADRCKDDA
jgi:hypothetical protein